MDSDEWTIGELAARVAAALDDGYPGAPNGRVRDLPDARSIRWYATIGLVDRPSAMRGRTALYGPRHLLQLVAVKRRQAQGHTIAQIQEELAGAGETTLRAIAGLPEALPSPDAGPVSSTPPGPAPPAPAEPAARSARFWAAPPAASPAPGSSAAPDPPAVAMSSPPTDLAATPAPVIETPLLSGIPLAGGAVLLLPATPDPDDLTAIAVAARPLLDLLSARGLLRSAP